MIQYPKTIFKHSTQDLENQIKIANVHCSLFVIITLFTIPILCLQYQNSTNNGKNASYLTP